MFVPFLPIFVANTKIIFCYNFGAPLTSFRSDHLVLTIKAKTRCVKTRVSTLFTTNVVTFCN